MSSQPSTRRFVRSIAVFVVTAVAAGACFAVLQGMGLVGGATGLLGEAQSESPIWVTIGFVVLATVSASALVVALFSLWQMTKTSAERVAAAPTTAVGIATAKEVTNRTRESAIASTAAAGAGARQLAATVQNRSRPVARRGGRAAKVIEARSAESIDNLLDRAERRGQPALAPPAPPAPTGPTTTPEGWYPCPYDGSRIRWFDGTAWSEHSRPAQ